MNNVAFLTFRLGGRENMNRRDTWKNTINMKTLDIVVLFETRFNARGSIVEACWLCVTVIDS
jgi:hypothetical protein